VKTVVGISIVSAIFLGASVVYARGNIDLPGICDPADTLEELPGQWGAKIFTQDCVNGGARRAVIVLDNDYAFERHNCQVYATRSSAPIEISFASETSLVISTSSSVDELMTPRSCGPIHVEIRRKRPDAS
jgi:hypothetical protein